MLVIKRALSLVLSTMLAVPVNVWARTEHAAKPSSKAAAHVARPKLRKGFVAVDKAAIKSASRTPSRSQRKPASQVAADQPMTPAQALHSVMPPMTSKNGFKVVDVEGKQKRLKSRTVSKGDYRQIIADEDDDGFADVYEVTKGNMTTKAYRPYRGKFTRIDIQDRRKAVEVNSVLMLDPDTQKYRIVRSQVHKYVAANSINPEAESQSAFANTKTTARKIGLETAGMCAEQVTQINSFEQLLKQIQDAVDGNKITSLECKLNRYQDLFFDKSCDSGDFKKSKVDMIKGLAKLMGSVDSKSPSQYLQCLTEKGYGAHSARIQNFLATRLQNAKEVLKNEAGWDDSKFADNNCERLEKVDVKKENGKFTSKKLTEVVSATPGPVFNCSEAPKLSPPPAAQFFYETQKVSLYTNSAPISSSYGIAAQDAYGSIMMHELLHYSGLNQSAENLIEQAQNCCAPNKYSASSTTNACNSLAKRARDEKMISALSQSPGYLDVVRGVGGILESSEADKFMDNFSVSFASSPQGIKALKTLESCLASANGDAALITGCRTQIKIAAATYAKAYIPQIACPQWKSDYTTASLDCKTTTDRIVEVMDPREGQQSDIVVMGKKSKAEPISVIDNETMAIDAAALAPINLDFISEIPSLAGNTSPAAKSASATAPASAYVPSGSATVASGVPSATSAKSSGLSRVTQAGSAAVAANQPASAARTTTAPAAATQPAAQPTTQPAAQPAAGAPSFNVANGAAGETQTNVTRPTVANQPAAVTDSGASAAMDSDQGADSSATASTRGSSNASSNTYSNTYSNSGSTATSSSGTPMPLPTSAGIPLGRGDTPLDTSTMVVNGLDVSRVGSAITKAAQALIPTASAATTFANAAAFAPRPENYRAPAAASYVSSNSSQGSSGSSGSGGGSRSSSNSASASRSRSSNGSNGASGGDDDSQSSSGSKSSAKASAKQSAKAGAGAESNAQQVAEGEEAQADFAGQATVDAKGAARSAASIGGASNFAASGNSGVSQQGNWSPAPSRTQTITRLVKMPASSVRVLAEKRNSGFARDLQSKKIGIQMPGGGVIGYSEPNFQFCGEKIVALGACR